MSRHAAGVQRAAAAAVLALLVACAPAGDVAPVAAAAGAPARPAGAPAARVLELRNSGFEAEMKTGGGCAVGWDCTMHNNPESFRFSLLQAGAAAGSRSLCVERVVDEPWALVTQAFQTPSLRGQRLRLSMAVRVEGAAGEGAGPWALAQGRPPVSARRLVRGSAAWQRVALEFAVPADAAVVEVGATLEGPGTACFDDVHLEVL
jgi:hypothetical protein